MATRSTSNAYDIEMIKAERDEARATVAALTAERADLMAQLAACCNAEPPNSDSAAAYRRGWDAAREAAVKSLRDAAEYQRSEWIRTSGGKDISSLYLHTANCQHAMSERVSALQPTEHDANRELCYDATALDPDGVQWKPDPGYEREAEYYLRGNR